MFHTKAKKTITILGVIIVGFFIVTEIFALPDPNSTLKPTTTGGGEIAPEMLSLASPQTLIPIGPPLKPEPGVTIQAFMDRIVIHNRNENRENRFTFLPLGQMHFPATNPTLPIIGKEALYVNGHNIHQFFWDEYRHHQFFHGLPVREAEMGYNALGEKVFFQVFQNSVLYVVITGQTTLSGTPPLEIHTFDLGAAYCAGQIEGNREYYCGAEEYTPVDMIDNGQLVIPEPFATAIYERWSALRFGYVLVPPFEWNEDIFLVLDNMVLYHDKGKTFVRAYPTVRALGKWTEPPGPHLDDDRLDFHRVEGELGYDIPRLYKDEFLIPNGSLDEFWGPPVSQNQLVVPGHYRQCFSSSCIEYIPNNPLGYQFQLMPIGKDFLEYVSSQIQIAESQVNQNTGYRIYVSNLEKDLKPLGVQTFKVSVAHPTEPMNGLLITIELTLPGGKKLNTTMPATGFAGTSEIRIPYETHVDQLKVESGSYVTANICLAEVPEPVCAVAFYTLWPR